jgi:type II secretory pathway pseudopilin PulG
MRSSANGFSAVELLVALTIALVVTGSAIALMLPSQSLATSRSEAADMQQRLRVAADTLYQRLVAAGAGAYGGIGAGPLSDSVAPILPYRGGGASADPPGSFKSDTITMLSVPKDPAQPIGTTYWLKTDDATATYQLTAADTTTGVDVPVVDHVVALAFEYYGDPQPPTMRKPLADPVGPWTTYGPKPASSAAAPFDAGENCVFFNDGSQTPQPRLAVLGPASASLVALTSAQLTDGPWCPNAGAADRWDADLLRIRSIAVRVRVQAALATLRGPASALFIHGGTSRSGHRWLPDLEIRFQVSPRNLNIVR